MKPKPKKPKSESVNITNCTFTGAPTEPASVEMLMQLANAAHENAIAITAIAKALHSSAPMLNIN